MSADLGVGVSESQWVVNGYFVTMLSLMLTAGSFGEHERSRAVGVYMGLTAVATAAGPVLGGLLVDLVSWRAIFVAPLVFPVAAAFVTYAAVSETPPNPDRGVDTKGALLAFLTIPTLSFALIQGPTGWLRAEVIVALAAAVVSASAFVRWQRHGPDPMLPLGLTPVGEQAFRKAGREDLRGLDEHIGSHLTRSEMQELRRMLTQLADAL